MNVHAVCSIKTLKFCTRLLCVITKTSTVGGWVLSDFSSVKIFWKIWPTLVRPNCFAKKKKKGKKKEVGPLDGHVEHVCKIQGLSKRRGHLAICA